MAGRLRKFGVTATLVAPFIFGVSTEAEAEQQPEWVISNELSKSNIVYDTPNIVNSYHNSSSYDNKPELNNIKQEVGKTIITAIGIVAVTSGAIAGGYYIYNKKRTDDSFMQKIPQHTVRIVPIGPEDDPDFWPPKNQP